MAVHASTPRRWPVPRAAIWAVSVTLVLLAAVVLERTWPHAALLALLLVVGGLGTLHGALDTVLIMRLLSTTEARVRALLGYLGATLLTAWLLLPYPAMALMVLLGLSMWHFGESFGRASESSGTPGIPGTSGVWAFESLMQRVLRGGAPVLMPALVSRTELAPLAQVVAAGDATALAMNLLWGFWIGLAWLWAAAGATWLLRCAAGDAGWQRQQVLLLEVAALAALNLVCSPLMAFALYFGLYHAAGHIGRVWATQEASRRAQLATDWRVWMTLLLSLALMAWLASGVNGVNGVIGAGEAALPLAWPDTALRLLIVGLVAVSVPHVALVGWWAHQLRGKPS